MPQVRRSSQKFSVVTCEPVAIFFTMITLKPATATDAELIAGMSRETFYDTYAEVNTKEDMDKFLSEQFTPEQLITEVKQEGNIFLLAYEDDQPAGYIFLKDEMHPHIPNENAVEISRIYVKKSFIGKGVGKALIQAAVSHALAENKSFIWLAVWEHNLRAINFYTSFGFEKFAEQNFVLGNDVQRDWVMRVKVVS
jgi:ribosomal protein S18 acetylase RimI-like enzyme